MHKKIFFTIAILTIVCLQLQAQQIDPQKLGFRPYTIKDKNLGEVNFYVSTNKIDQVKPLLLYLDGSGPFPLFQYTERGIGSSVVIDFRNLSNEYHVVLISKPGVPFIDSVKTDKNSGIPMYDAPKQYREKLSLDWRVNAAKLVLNKIMQELKVDKKKIAGLGISEGFQVGAKLASLDKSLTHLILLAGNGLNQFYDFIIQNRIDAQKGIITDEEAQKNMDSLLLTAKAIYADPGATDKEWYGHTYLRWSSFTNNDPTENILSLSIPVYIAAAANDRNTSVLGTDYLVLESTRHKKTNITYKVYPYDHSFNEQIKNDKGQIISVTNHIKKVIQGSLDWLKEN